MARTYTISGSLITISGDPFEEGKDDFIELDLVDENGDAISDAAVSAITATLRSRLTGSVINSRDGQDVLDANDGTLTSGTFKLELGGTTDLVADGASAGARTLQPRELTVLVAHSGGKQVPLVVRFPLRVFDDVG